MQPGKGALHHPTRASQPRAVPYPASGQPRPDPTGPQRVPVWVGVVGAIPDQLAGAPQWPARAAADGRDLIHQRQELGDIVTVAAGHPDSQRQPTGVHQQVMLTAGPAPIDRAWPHGRVPLLART
jgi:hypothetical protein